MLARAPFFLSQFAGNPREPCGLGEGGGVVPPEDAMNGSRMAHDHARFPRQPISGFVVALLIVLFYVSAFSSSAQSGQARIVAVGDIHGDYEAFVSILREAKLIDSRRHWKGGKATLVQTGDFLDRGPKSREVLDLLMALEKQARKKGGQVIVLLGNHEMMNLTGDLRYVSGEDYASFADKRSEKRRQSAYQAYVELRKKRAQALNKPPPVFTPETEKDWMEEHPLGFVEHRKAFGPTGQYGRWLRQRLAVTKVGDLVFLHGGINPALASWEVEAINKRIKEETRAFDAYKQYLAKQKLILPFFALNETTAAARVELEARETEAKQRAAEADKVVEPTEQEEQHLKILGSFLAYGGWLSIHPDGPLWFRGFANWSEDKGASHVADLLGKYGASAFVVGHTPQQDGRIHTRFDRKVFLIDTGMLAGYYPGGRASALEIQNGKFTAIYLGQQRVLLDRAAMSLPSNQEGSVPVGEVPSSELAYEMLAPPPLLSPATAAQVWLGPEGERLPFTSDEEIMEFLRTARVIRFRGIPQGVTHPRKALLEKDGVRMHAIFRDVNQDKRFQKLAGTFVIDFRDSYIFEPAAYELSRLLGLDNVPPVILRKVRGKSGSLQVWLENAKTEKSRVSDNITPPDKMLLDRQIWNMRVFDNLIYNTDRNQGNILYDGDWRVWLIDHTRAFRLEKELRNPELVVHCDRKLWEKLKSLDEQVVRERLKKFLRSSQIKALLRRRDKLVKHIQKLIEERGENKVLFTLN